jgi:hypothetical protein
MEVIKGLRHVYIFHLESLYGRFEYGFKHPYLSMLGRLMRGFMTFWTLVISSGLLFGFIHITH